jgi:hypothetical protein
VEGGAAGPSNRGPFEYSNIAFASNTEVKLLSHLLIHHAYSTDTKKSLITAAQMVLEDSQDYDTTSPVEQGPWTIPLSWGVQGSPLDLCGDFLVAATSLKAGYLAPVELSKTKAKCTRAELSKHSPHKAAVKEENFVLLDRVASLEGIVSELTAEAARSEKSKVALHGGGGTTMYYGTRVPWYVLLKKCMHFNGILNGTLFSLRKRRTRSAS